jgi:hypothetical protein
VPRTSLRELSQRRDPGTRRQKGKTKNNNVRDENKQKRQNQKSRDRTNAEKTKKKRKQTKGKDRQNKQTTQKQTRQRAWETTESRDEPLIRLVRRKTRTKTLLRQRQTYLGAIRGTHDHIFLWLKIHKQIQPNGRKSRKLRDAKGLQPQSPQSHSVTDSLTSTTLATLSIHLCTAWTV